MTLSSIQHQAMLQQANDEMKIDRLRVMNLSSTGMQFLECQVDTSSSMKAAEADLYEAPSR